MNEGGLDVTDQAGLIRAGETTARPAARLSLGGGICAVHPLFNITGQPAMSVPLYWNDAGLPIGAHFAGRFGDEATFFRLTAQLEEARPWAALRPPVFA